MPIRVLTWNLYHGRDFPPNPGLRTWRSRLLRITERDATHVQVNRELFREFAGVLATADWDAALLQECPPRWSQRLAAACGAEAHRVLTARNSCGWLRSAVARLNPDLLASNEGGSNLTLVRTRAGEVTDRAEIELRPRPRHPERRTMALTRVRLAGEPADLCVANLHASAGAALRSLAERQVLDAAERAVTWAGDAPLVFGGDLNLRPAETKVFEQLADRLGLAPATGPDALDHLLVRRLEVVEPPRAWPAERREVADDDRAIRLSDHAPVEAAFAATSRPPPNRPE